MKHFKLNKREPKNEINEICIICEIPVPKFVKALNE